MIQFNEANEGEFEAAVSGEALLELARQRMSQGLAPPPEIYRIEYRRRIDWAQCPSWARPADPQMFDGCCHEG